MACDFKKNLYFLATLKIYICLNLPAHGNAKKSTTVYEKYRS